MEKKLKIAEFAALVGTSQKTVYSRLSNPDNLPVNEQLTSVIEKVRGRETTFIVTSEEQIKLYQTIFNYLPVNEGNYEDNLIFNNSSGTVNGVNKQVKKSDKSEIEALNPNEIIKQILDLNEVHREELNKVNDELIEYKSKVLLLADKEGREGFQLNEINELRKDKEELITANYKQRNVIIGLAAVIILLTTSFFGYFTFNKKVNELQERVNIQEEVINDKKPAAVQEVVKPQAPQQANNANVQRKRK